MKMPYMYAVKVTTVISPYTYYGACTEVEKTTMKKSQYVINIMHGWPWQGLHYAGMPAYSEHVIAYASAYLPIMSISHIFLHISCS